MMLNIDLHSMAGQGGVNAGGAVAERRRERVKYRGADQNREMRSVLHNRP